MATDLVKYGPMTSCHNRVGRRKQKQHSNRKVKPSVDFLSFNWCNIKFKFIDLIFIFFQSCR